MSQIRLSITTGSEILERLAQIHGKERQIVLQLISEVFAKHAVLAASHVVKTQLSGGGPAPTFGGPGSFNKKRKKRRTGSLARSIEGRALQIEGAPAIQVGVLRGPAVRYAGIQEFGTKPFNPDSPFPTIKPRNAKALAQPVGEALTSAGVARYPSPRAFPEPLKFIRFGRPRGRNKVIGILVKEVEYQRAREAAIAEGSDVSLGQIDALYILMLQLDIRPGLFITDGLQSHFPKLLEAIADVMVERVFNG